MTEFIVIDACRHTRTHNMARRENRIRPTKNKEKEEERMHTSIHIQYLVCPARVSTCDDRTVGSEVMLHHKQRGTGGTEGNIGDRTKSSAVEQSRRSHWTSTDWEREKHARSKGEKMPRIRNVKINISLHLHEKLQLIQRSTRKALCCFLVRGRSAILS